jgi:tRNA A64-2'-O-ribosylphosphate transferase
MPKTLEASARAYIRRESLDIYNRLHSIDADIAFVNQVRAAYPTLPLIRTARPLPVGSICSSHLTRVP